MGQTRGYYLGESPDSRAAPETSVSIRFLSNLVDALECTWMHQNALNSGSFSGSQLWSTTSVSEFRLCIIHQMPLPYISKVLGHSTIDSLVRNYAGWISNATKEYDAKLKEAFSKNHAGEPSRFQKMPGAFPGVWFRSLLKPLCRNRSEKYGADEGIL